MNDNKIAALIFGEGDKNIKHIEKLLDLRINARGNILCITGQNAEKAKNIINWNPQFSDLENIIKTTWDVYDK